MFGMLPVVADFERSIIQERVRAGLCGLWGIPFDWLQIEGPSFSGCRGQA